MLPPQSPDNSFTTVISNARFQSSTLGTLTLLSDFPCFPIKSLAHSKVILGMLNLRWKVIVSDAVRTVRKTLREIPS